MDDKMLLTERSNEEVFKKFQVLCNILNLESSVSTQAWDKYIEVNNKYSLEGDAQHWLCCAILIECMKSATPTVGQSVLQGNCVNVTSLLRYCNLSLVQFFSNIKRWIEMAQVSSDLQAKINGYERNFSVAYNVFNHFPLLYKKIFKMPYAHEFDVGSKPRSRKQRTLQCTPAKLIEFCWYLFITIKSEDSTYSTDIVKSCNLLVTVLDLIFKNVCYGDHKELLNADMASEYSVGFPVTDKLCIIDYLSIEEKNSLNCKYIKNYCLKEIINKMFNNGILMGNKDNFTGILDGTHFDSNFKSVCNSYSAHLLNRGDFDEKILFAEYKRKLLLEAERLQTPNNLLDESGENLVTSSPGLSNFAQSPVVRDTIRQNDIYSKFQLSLNNRSPEASAVLLQMLGDNEKETVALMGEIVDRLGKKFTDSMQEHSVLAGEILTISTKLYYKFVEILLQNEISISKDISALIKKARFFESVFASALELIIHANSKKLQKPFPWVLKILDIQPYYFVMLIELLLRSEDTELPNASNKHLTAIEGEIFSHLMWTSDSCLWQIVEGSGQPLPKFEDVALPDQLIHNKAIQSTPSTPTTALYRNNNLLSPVPSSATERFQSPVNQASNNSVNRQLFPSGGQSILQKHTHLMIQNDKGVQRLIPIISSEVRQQQQQQPPPTNCTPKQEQSESSPVQNKPRKGGSLALVLRRFYNLVSGRIRHLCNKLNIRDLEIQRSIWTLFEESIINTDLIKDRHVDQLWMCAVYVICVIYPKGLTTKQLFRDIMQYYREQPQAESHIYRNVPTLKFHKKKITKDKVQVELPKEIDLIAFYNDIYIDTLNSYITNLRQTMKQNQPMELLSPLPFPRIHTISPSVKISKTVSVKPLEVVTTTPDSSSKNYKTYYFSRSPSKDLTDINRAVRLHSVAGKRLLTEGNGDSAKRSCTKNIQSKVQSLIEERTRSQTNE